AGGHGAGAVPVPAIDAVAAGRRRVAAEQVDLELLEIEDVEQILDGREHGEAVLATTGTIRKPAMAGSRPQPYVILDAASSATHRRADRRRRLFRSGAGDRAAPRARPLVLGGGRRSGAGARRPPSAGLRP